MKIWKTEECDEVKEEDAGWRGAWIMLSEPEWLFWDYYQLAAITYITLCIWSPYVEVKANKSRLRDKIIMWKYPDVGIYINDLFKKVILPSAGGTVKWKLEASCRKGGRLETESCECYPTDCFKNHYLLKTLNDFCGPPTRWWKKEGGVRRRVRYVMTSTCKEKTSICEYHYTCPSCLLAK